MNIDLNYPIKEVEGKTRLSNSELTLDYIGYAVSKKYPSGISGQLMRIWGRIQNKFDVAIENKVVVIDLEDAEIEFIKKIMSEEVGFPSHLAKCILVLDAEIDSLKIK